MSPDYIAGLFDGEGYFTMRRVRGAKGLTVRSWRYHAGTNPADSTCRYGGVAERPMIAALFARGAELCPVCGVETTFQHDHKPDNTGLDDGPNGITVCSPCHRKIHAEDNAYGGK